MTLIRDFLSYRKFAAATPEQIQGLWDQAGHIHPKLVFNPTTGTYPAVGVVSVAAEDEAPTFNLQVSRSLSINCLPGPNVSNINPLILTGHEDYHLGRPTMNPGEPPRPIPQPTDIENLARMILTYRRQFHYSWEQIVCFLWKVGFSETNVKEVKALFEKYEHDRTMGSMHGVYDT
ncbi:hypothetical protein MMC08_004291 [Hypocenomyce scalaris]|nr:hypothetical protein [Hypocenomyce scalaris]